MISFKSFTLAALVAIAAISCNKPSNIQVTDFNNVTVFTPLEYEEQPVAIVCDSTLTASIVEYDTTVVTITLKGGVAGNGTKRVFSVVRNPDAPKTVIVLRDQENGEQVVLLKLVHQPTKTLAWFIKTEHALIRLSELQLSCDEI